MILNFIIIFMMKSQLFYIHNFIMSLLLVVLCLLYCSLNFMFFLFFFTSPP